MSKFKVLLIDRDPSRSKSICQSLKIDGPGPQLDVLDIPGISGLYARLGADPIDAVVLCTDKADSATLDAIAQIKMQVASAALVVVSPADAPYVALTALNLGAQDFVVLDANGQASLRRVIQYSVERSRREQRHLNQAFRDMLTGLPTRALFEERLMSATARCRRTGTSIALMFLDLDRFKYVNDTFGHDAGDEVLVVVSQRLVRSVREADYVARQGGDEFLVLLESVEDHAMIPLIAERILSQVCKTIAFGRHELQVGASIGVAVFPEDGAERAALVGRADAAMYAAKHGGRNQIRYFADLDEETKAAASSGDKAHDLPREDDDSGEGRAAS